MEKLSLRPNRWDGIQLASMLHAALPTLDINEGALDKIFAIYKQLLPVMGGYLTDAGALNAGRLEALLQHLALQELETLEQRAAVCILVPHTYACRLSGFIITTYFTPFPVLRD